MTEIIYRVRRKFKYNKKEYLPGEIFQPEGGKWDTTLTDPDAGYIILERAGEEKEAVKSRRRRKNDKEH